MFMIFFLTYNMWYAFCGVLFSIFLTSSSVNGMMIRCGVMDSPSVMFGTIPIRNAKTVRTVRTVRIRRDIGYGSTITGRSSTALSLFQTNIKDIIRNQAIFDSLRKRISYEIIDVSQLASQLFQINMFHNHSEIFIILQFIIFTSSILYDLNPDSVRLYIKLCSLSEYKDIEKKMNIFVLCIALIMMKNIENAL